jgi:hypothetical protein
MLAVSSCSAVASVCSGSRFGGLYTQVPEFRCQCTGNYKICRVFVDNTIPICGRSKNNTIHIWEFYCLKRLFIFCYSRRVAIGCWVLFVFDVISSRKIVCPGSFDQSYSHKHKTHSHGVRVGLAKSGRDRITSRAVEASTIA